MNEAVDNGDVPEGWALATIPDVIGAKGVFADGDWVESKDQDPSGGVRLIQLADVGDGEFRNRSSRFMTDVKAAELSCTFLKSGDILVARMPEPLGRACVFPGDDKPSVTVVDVCIVRPETLGVERLWLLHAINSPQFRWKVSDYELGTTRKRISRSNLGRIAVPVPPLVEQQRIVAKVEALLARVNAARQRLAKAPAILKRFRQSVLATACSGRLTADWRNLNSQSETGAAGRNVTPPAIGELPELPDSWAWTTPDAITTNIVDCPHSTPRWAESGHLCLRTTNFRPGFLDLSEVRYVSDATFQERVARLCPQPGDVVYSREGGILGIACVIPPGIRACLGQRMMLFRVQPDCSPVYLMHMLNSPLTTRRVQELTGGTASPHLNVGDIKQFPVPLPPNPEQQEIVRRVEALFKLADAIEKRVTAATARAERLTQAILAKAFRGELVPTEAELARREGRDYEPASALLKRIREDRGAGCQTKRRVRRTP